MILKQGHTYEPMPHDGKVIRRIYRGGRCYYIASPYSPEATQALRAAFPQYFAAICDYGYAHPQLVPFINEDPMLIVSLVEVGKVRTLDGTANAYIDTGHKPTSTTILEAFYALVINEYSSCGSRLNYGTDMFVIHNGPNIKFMIGTQTVMTGINTSLSTFYKLKLDAQGKAFVNDNVWNTNKFNGNNFNIWLFANNNGGAVHNSNGARYEYATIYEGTDQVAHFIPMQRTDGTCGMLDIVSLTFHPNANTQGTFTIQLTDKA